MCRMMNVSACTLVPSAPAPPYPRCIWTVYSALMREFDARKDENDVRKKLAAAKRSDQRVRKQWREKVAAAAGSGGAVEAEQASTAASGESVGTVRRHHERWEGAEAR